MIHALAIGTLAMELGAGRQSLHDTIDPRVGNVLLCHKDMKVCRGDPIAQVHAASPLDQQWLDRLQKAIEIR